MNKRKYRKFENENVLLLKIELRLYLDVCVCHSEGLNYLDRISSGFVLCLRNFSIFYEDHVEAYERETSIFEMKNHCAATFDWCYEEEQRIIMVLGV